MPDISVPTLEQLAEGAQYTRDLVRALQRDSGTPLAKELDEVFFEAMVDYANSRGVVKSTELIEAISANQAITQHLIAEGTKALKRNAAKKGVDDPDAYGSMVSVAPIISLSYIAYTVPLFQMFLDSIATLGPVPPEA